MPLAKQLGKGRVRFLNGTQVLGIYPEQTLLLAHPRGKVAQYRADTMILATGAREKYLPFKGWTLPGVMATGAAQILMKSSGILPGKQTLIGGCGPLMFGLAAEILANRGAVQAILDQTTLNRKLKIVTAGRSVWPKILQAARYLKRLVAARVPLRQGIRIVEACGRQHLENVVTAKVDARGRVIRGTETVYPTDTLAVGYGFSPNIELPQQAGCALSHAIDKGGWHVDVDKGMATSVNGIYAVGEITGIAGAAKSIIEGRMAAWDILYRQERADRQAYETHIRRLRHQRRQQVRLGRFLNQLCRLEPDNYLDIPEETVICRCEEITMGEIRRQLNHGFTTMHSIKKATRCGMGYCQGRTCAPILFDLITAFSRQPPRQVGTFSARAPVKPVTLGALAQMTKHANKLDDHSGSD